MPQTPLSEIRKSYTQAILLEEQVAKDPILQLQQWIADSIKAEVEEPNAMTLATCDKEGHPDARIVLLKSLDEEGLVFFTNYDSQKGNQLKEVPKVSVVFFWKELERQIRIKGTVEKISDAASDEYFYSRPLESQLGAIASNQSKLIANRTALDAQYNRIKNDSESIKRPQNWGGYLIKPRTFEFWQGRVGRMHDRILYQFLGEEWTISRLQP